MATKNVSQEEFNVFLSEPAESAMPADLPRTLVEAFYQGIKVTPAVFQTQPFKGMGPGELSPKIAATASKYAERIKYSIMFVNPATLLDPTPVKSYPGIIIAAAAIVVVAMVHLTYRAVKSRRSV